MAAAPPLRLDLEGALIPNTGISRRQLEQLGPRLEQIRQEIVEEDPKLLADPESIPEEKQPLDAGFFELPEQLLTQYRQQGEASQLGRVFEVAKRLCESVDRVVLLGIGGSYMGARALMEACCQPYYNELSRAERGSHPRIYFEGNNLDNDAVQGLLHLLGAGRPARTVDDRWAIVVISKSGGTIETAVAFRLFLAALRDSCGGDPAQLAELVVPITGRAGRLRQLAEALGCRDVLPVPDGVGGRFSVLSAVGLLPAALLGIDVMQLLRGAAAMNRHFRTAPPEENMVLQYAGICHLMEVLRGATIRVLSIWAKAWEAVGLWYDQLLAESLGKNELGATPLTVVNTRDLHSRAQQHQEGRRDKLITNVIIDSWRCDPLRVGRSELDQDGLNDLADKPLGELMSAAIAGTNQAYREDGRPTIDLHLPAPDEGSLGQLLQMLMLATVVEGRLLGVNPYGQPGVEKYKRNMNALLGRG